MSLQIQTVTEPTRCGADTAAAVAQSHCLRGSLRVRIEPTHADGPRAVELRCLWQGATGAPTVIVQGGISATRDVCSGAAHPADGWWQPLVGAGRAIDLEQFRVLAIDWLDGSSLDAPAVTSADQADALAAVLDALHIGQVAAFVGASYGAMVGLAFAARHPQRLQQLVAVAGAHRPHPLASAQRAIQRGIVRLGLETGHVKQALALARQLAMTTYRGSEELAQRFAGPVESHAGCLRRPVEAWLEHVGAGFAEHFDARRYLSLSESIDLHEVDPAAVCVPTRLIGIASDRLVPLADLCALQRGIHGHASLDVIDSPYGHDGFLKEHARLAPLLSEALAPMSLM